MYTYKEKQELTAQFGGAWKPTESDNPIIRNKAQLMQMTGMSQVDGLIYWFNLCQNRSIAEAKLREFLGVPEQVLTSRDLEILESHTYAEFHGHARLYGSVIVTDADSAKELDFLVERLSTISQADCAKFDFTVEEAKLLAAKLSLASQ